jgi:hypothetical protein
MKHVLTTLARFALAILTARATHYRHILYPGER